jgi:hypothetical protein
MYILDAKIEQFKMNGGKIICQPRDSTKKKQTNSEKFLLICETNFLPEIQKTIDRSLAPKRRVA